jgi:23S rRNA G2069 N7-methylase RlmK/C1962 C5-methylase RlmI
MLTGCQTTTQARSVKTNGFLGDSASLLQKGGKGDFLLVYRKKDADWKAYNAILLDPITIWGAENSTLPKDQQADYQKLVDQFYAMLKEKLSKDYTIIDTAGLVKSLV